MKQEELIEELAFYEHASWAKWQEYLHSICLKNNDGSLTIPASYVEHWNHQIETQYDKLSEKEKQSDRNEVYNILPIIERYKKEPSEEECDRLRKEYKKWSEENKDSPDRAKKWFEYLRAIGFKEPSQEEQQWNLEQYDRQLRYEKDDDNG